MKTPYLDREKLGVKAKRIRRAIHRRIIMAAVVGHLLQAAFLSVGTLTIERVVDGFGALAIAVLHLTEREADVDDRVAEVLRRLRITSE